MTYALDVIPTIGATSAQHAAFIKASYDNGGVFRHIANGRNKAVHAKIIIEAITKLSKAGKSINEIEFELNSPVYSVGNTSAWGKLLNDSLNWIDEDGMKITFAARFNDKIEPSANLTAI